MIKVRNRIICTFVMIIAMTLCFGMVAEATTTQEQINQTQGKLDEANETLNQLREEQAKQNKELSNMNTQMDSISNKIAGLQSQITDTQADIDKLSEEMDLLSADIEEQYNNMKLRIKFMYENGTHSAIDMILSATDFKDLLSKSEYVYQITKYDNAMMGNLNDAMNLLAQTKASVEEDMAELNNLKADASSESENLKSLIFNMQNQIDINSANIEETEALCKKYEEQLEKEKLDARIQRDFQQYSRKQLLNGLKDLLPQRLIPVVLDMAYLDEEKFINQISKEERQRLLDTLKRFVVPITATRPLAEAIVTAGGVDVKEINPKTMESKLVGGLFFAGEVMDVDGYTGGFNLQAAFSSGYAAGLAASNLE